MRLKIRKMCVWIIFVQLILIAIHIKFYQSFTGLNNLSTKTNIQLTKSDERANKIQHLVNISRKDFSKQKQFNEQTNNGNVSLPLLKGEPFFKRSFSKLLRQTVQPRHNVTPRHTATPRHTVTPRLVVQSDVYKRNISGKGKIRAKFSVLRTCHAIIFPVNLEHGDIWQPVGQQTAFVFSAYYVEKKENIVIIGAISKQRTGYFCLLWQQENGEYNAEQIAAKAKQLPEGHDLWFSAAIFECHLPSYGRLPSHVSLVTSFCGVPANVLRVHSTTVPETYQRRFTVCLTPLNTQYGRAYELVEWIELNIVLGAEKFIVYNHSMASNVLRVLDYYTKKHLVEVVQWQLPMEVLTYNDSKQPEIHYFGQIVALQDCLYRNKIESEFIVNIDLDEFIIPHSENVSTWSEMLKQLNNESGAYIFRNTFFRKEWENVYFSNKGMVDKYRLVTLQKLYREENIFPVKRRSKYFARTSDVALGMIHDVLHLPKRKKAQDVAIEIGLLHHYRDWENEMSLPNLKVFDDTIPQKYSEKLINNVAQVWSQLVNVEMDMHVQR